MRDGLDCTQGALNRFRSIYGNKSTKGLCQQFDGYYWQWDWQGNEDGIAVYASAKLAADASVMFTTDVNSALIEPGDLLYWHFVDGNGNNYGHVCTAVGRDGARVLVSNTATTGDAYHTLTNDVKISHVDTINLRFRGASKTNGNNRPRTGIAPWPATVVGPQQRQVRSDVEARRRQGAPSTSAPQGDPLEAGTIGDFIGWVNGENVEGNNLWYIGAYGTNDYFWSGSFTEVSTHDLKDMNAPVVKPNQRQALSDGTARQRSTATTASPIVSEIPASAIATFDGWMRGESVSGNAVWFREAGTGLWSWSGGFTDTGTHDLPDLNPVTPPTPKPTTRTVDDTSVNVRATPYTSDAVIAQLQPGAIVEVAGWTTGERVSNQGIWYKVAQGWAWSGGFTSQSTDGLESLPAPTPPSGGVIDPVYKTFKPDSALATWIGSPNYNYRTPRPAGAVPTHVTMHSMEGTLAGTDTQFQKYENVVDGRGDGSASNYGVGQNAVHQYVRERDYQQADGDTSSNRWGISIEHEGSVTSPATQAVMDLSARLLVEIAKRYGWTQYVAYTDDPKVFRELPDATQLSIITTFAAQNPTRRLVFPHDAWAATECPGVLPWQSIIAAANKELAGVTPDPDPSEIILSREFVEAQVAAAEAQAALWKGLLS